MHSEIMYKQLILACIITLQILYTEQFWSPKCFTTEKFLTTFPHYLYFSAIHKYFQPCLSEPKHFCENDNFAHKLRHMYNF